MSKNTFKAVAIVEQARTQLKEFAKYEFHNIIQRRIALGEEDAINSEDEDADTYYRIDLTDYNINPALVDINVMNTYDMSISTEQRKVKEVLLDAETDEVYFVTEDMDLDHEDAPHINSLDTDSLKTIVVALEEVWNELIK